MAKPLRTTTDGRCALWIEPLEQRLNLAGNVTANIVNGDLVIIGDAAANKITIGVDSDNSVSVHGSEETIVSGNILSLGFSGDTIRIRMRGGGDTVDIDHLAANRAVNVIVDMGAGDDSLETRHRNGSFNYDIRLGGGNDDLDFDADANSLSVVGGSGNDYISVAGNNQQGDISIENIEIRSGGGDDDVVFEDADLRDIFVSTSGGNDYVATYGIAITGALTMVLAGGRDHADFNTLPQGQDLSVNTGAGDDVIYMNARLAGDLSLVTGGGADRVTIEFSELTNASAQAAVNLGAGSDMLMISDVTLQPAVDFVLGGGNDFCSMISTTSVATNLSMGAGKDTLQFGGTCGPVIADGGGSTDELFLGFQCLPSQFSHSGFENVTGP